jgi:hypothetical protein
MKNEIIEFPYNARTVYTAVKNVVRSCGRFNKIRCNDDTFVIVANHRSSLLSFGEDVKIRIVATGNETTNVVIESKSKIFLNFINGGANKKNVQALSDYIHNAVWKLLNVNDSVDHSQIKIVNPDIKMQ